MSLAHYPLLPTIKTIRKLPLDNNGSESDLDAIKTVNKVIVTVEKTSQVGITKETFITQAGGKILETRREDVKRSLQATLLLQAKKLLKNVEKELEEKRVDFKNRMEVCREKEVELEVKRKSVKDRVKKFERFLKENEIKRARAIEKADAERLLRGQKVRGICDLGSRIY